MELQSNMVCWFEIYVIDLARATGFYNKVLQIELAPAAPPPGSEPGMEMALFPGMENAPNASGALIRMEGVKDHGAATISTMVYFRCDDCKVEESRVEAAGGEVYKPKFSIGSYGFCSICLDTEGNVFGLHSMK